MHIGESIADETGISREWLFRTIITRMLQACHASPNSETICVCLRRVAMTVGNAIDARYLREERAATAPDMPVSLLTDLFSRIAGDATVKSDGAEEITITINRCPWMEATADQSQLCRVCAGIFGSITALYLGYARVTVESPGKSSGGHCRIRLALRPQDDMQGDIYTREEIEIAATAEQENHDFHPNCTALTLQLAEAERIAREEANTFKQLKQAFLSNVSHELRTPITVLQGYLGLLEHHTLGPLTTEQYEAIQTSQRNLDRLSRLINDLLDYSTLARGQATLKSESVNLTEVCWSSLRDVISLAQLRRVRIEQRINDTRDNVYGDPEKLRQIITHLLENAIKFSGTDQQVALTLQQQDDHLLIQVCDTGIGMTPEQLNQVFLPFVQGDTGLARRFGGLGMGLSLIHHLVTLHGGHIEMKSNPGKGTTVTIRLPVMTADS